jgi:hypothetical protein
MIFYISPVLEHHKYYMNHILSQKLSLPGGNVLEGPKGINVLQDINGNITIGSILSRILPLVFIFAGIGLLAMIIMGGFTLLTSAGDSKKLEQGKSKLTYAVVGFIIIFAAFWLVQIFGVMFGLKSMMGLFN